MYKKSFSLNLFDERIFISTRQHRRPIMCLLFGPKLGRIYVRHPQLDAELKFGAPALRAYFACNSNKKGKSLWCPLAHCSGARGNAQWLSSLAYHILIHQTHFRKFKLKLNFVILAQQIFSIKSTKTSNCINQSN